MSSDLQWLLLRKHNSFIVKRVPEGPVFSKEPGNLRNLHSFKYSGLANSKSIDVSDNAGTIQITTRKPKAPAGAVSKSYAKSSIRQRSGPRRSLRVGAALARRGYRPDLRTAVLARVSALLAAQKDPKAAPAPKLRGNRAKLLAASQSAPKPAAKTSKALAKRNANAPPHAHHHHHGHDHDHDHDHDDDDDVPDLV